MCYYSCRPRFTNNCEVPRLPRGGGCVSLTGRRFSIATLGCMQEYSAEVVGVTANGFYPDSLERFKRLLGQF